MGQIEIFSRRRFLTSALAGGVMVLTGSAHAGGIYEDDVLERDEALLPPPESPIDFEIEPTDLDSIPEEFHRQMVDWDGDDEPGTIVVDPQERHLYLVLDSGDTAMRYGVGVGRQGFAWSGEATIGMKRRWPRWVPPKDMTFRDKKAAKWANGMPGGPENPLGARALYLYTDGKDTLFRIHGTTEPQSIGKAMSSGCIRMLNEDVEHLFLRVAVGTRVVVRGADDDYLASAL